MNLPGEKIDDAVSKVLEASLGKAVDGVSSTTATVWGGLLGDRLNEWRTRNLLGSLEKTAEVLKRKGIDIKNCHPLPNAELYALFDGASKQDDPDLQELWASLLANSLSPNGNKFQKEFTHIIDQLEPADARFFTFVVKAERFTEIHKKKQPAVPLDLFNSDESAEGAKNRRLWNEHTIELDLFRQEEFAKTELDEHACLEACGRLVRLALLRRSRPYYEHHFSGELDAKAIKKDLGKISQALEENHSGEINIHLFNAFRPHTRELNYKTTDFGQNLASACIS